MIERAPWDDELVKIILVASINNPGIKIREITEICDYSDLAIRRCAFRMAEDDLIDITQKPKIVKIWPSGTLELIKKHKVDAIIKAKGDAMRNDRK